MNWESFFKGLLEPEEYFIGACLQFPIYFVVGWWVIPIMLICSLFWRLGGVAGGNKLFRRIGVPLVICLSTFLVVRDWPIFLAIPFMVWLCPSYGEGSSLYKFYSKIADPVKADFLTRITTYVLYWASYFIAFIL